MAKFRRARRVKIVKGNCNFCRDKKEPSYRDTEALRRFITERGKIISRGRTGVCAKHQRKIAVAIKHARHLALLPFIVRPY